MRKEVREETVHRVMPVFEKVVYYITEDGEEFKNEQEANHHEYRKKHLDRLNNWPSIEFLEETWHLVQNETKLDELIHLYIEGDTWWQGSKPNPTSLMDVFPCFAYFRIEPNNNGRDSYYIDIISKNELTQMLDMME